MNHKNKECIMIVDDDVNVIKSLELIFKKKGYETETAFTGREALEKARKNTFNITLLDINLPDMEGIELILPLKELHPNMAVIMVTGYASMDNAVRALNEGAVAYNTKPLNMDEVLATVENVVEKQHLMFEKQQAEEALKVSENRFKDISYSMADWIWEVDKNGKYIFTSGKVKSILGYTPDELIGKTPFDLMPKNEAIKIEKIFKEIAAKKKPIMDLENWNLTKDGARICLLTNGVPILDEDGHLQGYRGVDKDITERKLAEEQIKQETKTRKTLMDNLPCIAMILRKGSREILASNKAAYEVGAIPGKTCYGTCVDRDDSCTFCLAPKLWETGEPQQLEVPYLGTYFDCRWVPLDDDLYVHYIFNITDRKKAEEEQKKLTNKLAQKNKELEQIVYSTSHDLRSPLVNTQGFSNELDASLKDIENIIKADNVPAEVREKIGNILNNDVSESLHYILTSVSKMDSLLNGLLKLSRLDRIEFKREKINMNSIISDIIKTHEFQIKEADINLEIGELPSCKGDETQINQVFSNLIDNAIKYSDPKRSGNIKIYGTKKKGQIEFCVEDNGIGIASKNQDKIFDIFHQLDPETSLGEGLGLTIIRKVLDKHDGQIRVESEPNKGSKFYVSVPAK